MTKPRRRWRRVLLIAPFVLTPIVVWFGIEVHWAFTAESQPVDLRDELNAIFDKYAPDGEDARPYIAEAAEIVRQIEADVASEFPRPEDSWLADYGDDYFEYPQMHAGRYSRAELQREFQALKRIRNSEISALIDRAAAAGLMYITPKDGKLGVLEDEIDSGPMLRSLSRPILALAVEALRDDDIGELRLRLRQTNDLTRLGHSCGSSSLSFLIADVIEHSALRHLRETLTVASPST